MLRGLVKEDFLVLVAIVVAIAGIVLLFFIAENSQAIETNIATINSLRIGSVVSLTAKVSWYRFIGNSLLFKLYDGNYISCIIFSPKQSYVELIKQKKIVKVIGRIALYKGRRELIVREVLPVE